MAEGKNASRGPKTPPAAHRDRKLSTGRTAAEEADFQATGRSQRPHDRIDESQVKRR